MHYIHKTCVYTVWDGMCMKEEDICTTQSIRTKTSSEVSVSSALLWWSTLHHWLSICIVWVNYHNLPHHHLLFPANTCHSMMGSGLVLQGLFTARNKSSKSWTSTHLYECLVCWFLVARVQVTGRPLYDRPVCILSLGNWDIIWDFSP